MLENDYFLLLKIETFLENGINVWYETNIIIFLGTFAEVF